MKKQITLAESRRATKDEALKQKLLDSDNNEISQLESSDSEQGVSLAQVVESAQDKGGYPHLLHLMFTYK